MEFRRDISFELEQRLSEPRSFIQIVLGPRQTGKTTAIRQALKETGLPAHVFSADAPQAISPEQLEVEWM